MTYCPTTSGWLLVYYYFWLFLNPYSFLKLHQKVNLHDLYSSPIYGPDVHPMTHQCQSIEGNSEALTLTEENYPPVLIFHASMIQEMTESTIYARCPRSLKS